MTLDDVSRDFSGMARSKVARYTEAFPDGLKLSRFLDSDGESSVFEMLHPARAAPAIRILVNENGGGLGKRRNSRHDQRRHG